MQQALVQNVVTNTEGFSIDFSVQAIFLTAYLAYV